MMQAFGYGRAFLFLGDIATFVVALFLTLAIRYQEVPSREVLDMHLGPFLFLFVLWSVVFLIAGLYDRHLLLARKRIPGLVFRVQALNILLAAVLFFLLPFGIAPKTNLVIYLLVSTGLIIGWRLYLFPLLSTGKRMVALVVGNTPEAQAVARIFAGSPYFQDVGAYLFDPSAYETEQELRSALLDFTEREEVDMVIADLKEPLAQTLSRDFYSLVFEEKGIHFYDLPAMYEQLYHRVPPSLVKEAWILENITTDAPHYAYDFLKRSIDVVGALILLIPCIVVFPLTALAIKLQDGGVVFYTTVRTGQFNRPVRIIKFRTMTGVDDGNTTLNTTLSVTPFGRFLRKRRIDELPQLLNILRGDLSFIGPRPELPSRAAIYAENIPYYNLRHAVKPGLSGWAQINHFEVPRGEVDIERTVDKLSFDLYYLKHRSFLLDMEIALKTIKTFLLRTGT